MAATVGSGNSVELDPVFLKALVLLHSKNPDSVEQLRALRDEAIRQHNQPVPLSSKERTKDYGKQGSDRRTSIAAVTPTETRTSSQVKDPKSELTTVETIEVGSLRIENVADVHAEGASIETVEELSSSMIETVEELSSSVFMTEAPISKKAKLEIHVDEDELKSHDTLPVEDLAIDLGTVCAVCFRPESSLSGNQFVECQECHSHYHQRCHDPRVSDQDVNDPRLVWYCTPCTKKMREMATSAIPKSRPTSESFTSSRLGPHRPPQLQPFKRQLSSSDSKSFGSPTTSQSFVIPALSNNSLGSSAKAGVTPGSQNIAMQSGMRRLQMMKKKAAQKILNQQQIRIPRR